MSRFFIDSDIELWYTKIKELGFDRICMPYTVDGEEYYDNFGENMDFKAFYDKLRAGCSASTSALNMQNYIDYFEPVFASGEDIIYVHFSSKMSGTFNQMDAAVKYLKEKYPERSFKSADTLQICVGGAVLVYEAGKMWKNGASDDEIIDFINNNRQHYALHFMVKDLSQLKRGGRLSTTSYVVGTMLNIKPLICVDNEGVLSKYGMAKGIKSGLKELVKKLKETGSDLHNHPLIIAHAVEEELADELEKMIIAEFGDGLEIWRQPIGPVVGCHCGAGTIGIAFHATHR